MLTPQSFDAARGLSLLANGPADALDAAVCALVVAFAAE